MPLGQFKQLIDDLRSFDFEKEQQEIVADNSEKLVELQREQMLEGRGIDGEYIRPFYSENPYFKTPEAAKRYAAWKKRITPNDKRPEDVPNLFVDGTLHRSLFAKVENQTFSILTNVSFGEKVFEVHKNAQGLDEESRKDFGMSVTLPQITQRLKDKTGLLITEK